MNIDYTLYLVTNNKNKTEEEFLNTIEESLKGGVSLVQLREKNLNHDQFLKIGIKTKKLLQKYETPLIINDNVEIAKELNATGVHIGQDDTDTKTARKLLGKDKIIGVSAHTIQEAKKAEEDGADYIGCGTIFKTPTKSNATYITKQNLIDIVNSVNIPVIYIGGITENNIKELENTGIKGVSVVSSIMESKNPKISSENLKKEIKKII